MEPIIRNISAYPGEAPARLIGAGDNPPLVTLAYSVIAPGGASSHHIHEWEHEVYIIAGRGTLVADGVEYPVRAGDAMFIPPRVDHVTRNDGGEGDIRRIEINPVSAAGGQARPGGSEAGAGVPPVIRNYADLDGGTGHTLLGGRDGCPNYLMLYNGAMAPGAVSHPETGGHTHEWDHTVFILEGTGTLTVSGRDYTVTAGDAVLVPPGQHHQWKNETDAPMLRVTFNDIKSEGHG